MTMETDLKSFVTGGSALAAQIGTRMYPLQLPQEPTLPALTYFQVDDPPEYAHEGQAGIHHPRWQFDVWASTYLKAKQVADLLIARLHAWHSSNASYNAFIGAEQDFSEAERELYRVSVDAIIWCRD